jgi:HlyD family secretion protein
MSDSHRIFRQAALARLSSPEQLDQLMQLTTPTGWLALGSCCLLVGIALVWGIWGSIRINVYGRGILIKQGGVFVATAFGDGRVKDILVTEGQPVSNHQLLARLEVPELELKRKQAELTLRKLEAELEQLKTNQANERLEETNYVEEQIKTYSLISNDYRLQISALEDRLKGLDELSRSNPLSVPKPTLLAVRNDWFSAKHGMAMTSVQIKQLRVNGLQEEERRRQLLLDKKALVDQASINLQTLTNLYSLTAEIRSPFTATATVLEITIKSNQLVNASTPIMSLQSAREKLQAWLFLAPGEGKRVTTNMEVHLALASAKKEEFGMMLGRVATVSTLPATPQLMSRVLENPTLVSEFLQEGAPIYAVVNLEPDSTTSGYRWTSGKGPEMRITSGTLCEGTITLTNRSPITLVLPLLRHDIGL